MDNGAGGDTRPGYANVASAGVFNQGPILLAPGGADPASISGVRSASYTGRVNMVKARGTSMAAPHVSAFYAGVKADNPAANVADISAWIQSPAGSIGVTLNLAIPPTPPMLEVFRRLRFVGP